MKTETSRLKGFCAIFNDFANAPFRLFFLSACLPAIFGASCWTLAYLDLWVFSTQPLDLNAFFFLQGLAGMVFAGFLFSVVPKWTGDATPLGNYMKSLWLIVFIACCCAPISLSIALSMMVLFWIYFLVLLTWLVWRKRDDRQISVAIMIALISLSTLILTIKSWQTELVSNDWEQQLHALVLGIFLLNFRFGRALGNQALEDSQQQDTLFIPNPYYKNLSVWLLYLLLANNLLIKNSVMEGWISLAIAGVALGRLREWHFLVLLKQHYIRWLYISMLMISLGYAWRGLALIEISSAQWLDPRMPLPIITISGLLLTFYQILNIVGLRHSHCKSLYPQSSRFALSALLLAGILHGIGDLFPPTYYPYIKIYLPNLFVVLAFFLYFPVFYRIFMRFEALVPREK